MRTHKPRNFGVFDEKALEFILYFWLSLYPTRNRLAVTIGCESAPKAGRLDSWSGHTEELKTFPVACSALMGGCKETVHMQCCH